MWSPPLGMWPRVVKVCARDRKGSVGNHTTSAPPTVRCGRKTLVCPHTAHTCPAFDFAHADPFLAPRLTAEPDKYGHPNRQIPDTAGRSRNRKREIFLRTSRRQLHAARRKEGPRMVHPSGGLGPNALEIATAARNWWGYPWAMIPNPQFLLRLLGARGER